MVSLYCKFELWIKKWCHPMLALVQVQVGKLLAVKNHGWNYLIRHLYTLNTTQFLSKTPKSVTIYCFLLTFQKSEVNCVTFSGSRRSFEPSKLTFKDLVKEKQQLHTETVLLLVSTLSKAVLFQKKKFFIFSAKSVLFSF